MQNHEGEEFPPIPDDAPEHQYVLWVDVPITRRQQMQHVLSPEGDVVFSCKYIADALEWLAEVEAGPVVICAGSGLYLYQPHRLNPK